MRQLELTTDLNLETVLQQKNGEDVVLTRQGHAVALPSNFDNEELGFYIRGQPLLRQLPKHGSKRLRV